MTTYRVDYIDPTPTDPGRVVVIHDLPRADAMAQARKLSKKHGTAYAVASDGRGDDLGQKVYADGRHSYSEGDF